VWGRIWQQVPGLQEELLCSNLFYTPFFIDGGAENLQIKFIDFQYEFDLNEKLNSLSSLNFYKNMSHRK